jgi:NAD(P)-dependent dehydrogenase (short-subunit alcohol dehydrogenase family)
MSKYTGKRAVVIGGTIGIGLATVKMLLEGGAEVLLTGRNEQNLDAARRELGSRAYVVRSDTASMTDIDALAGIVQEKLGQIDFVFINAGISGARAVRPCHRGLVRPTVRRQHKGRILHGAASGPAYTGGWLDRLHHRHPRTR